MLHSRHFHNLFHQEKNPAPVLSHAPEVDSATEDPGMSPPPRQSLAGANQGKRHLNSFFTCFTLFATENTVSVIWYNDFKTFLSVCETTFPKSVCVPLRSAPTCRVQTAGGNRQQEERGARTTKVGP